MNMLAYKTDTAWNRGIPCIFFKTLIQLYLLRSFLYSLTHCIKVVIKGKIFWRLNLKVPAYEAATAWNRGIPCKFFKTLIQLYLFCLFLCFRLTVSKRVPKAIFLDIKFKIVVLWGSYGLKRGNPLQNLKTVNQTVFFLSPDLLFYLMC